MRLNMRLARGTAAATGMTWCVVGRLAGAQLPGVAVDPHMLVLTPGRSGGEITVFNPRPVASEFTIELGFGYVTTDSAGHPRVALVPGPDSLSAADWVTPYPRRFRLGAHSSQTVRLLARPPVDLAAGEYWARLTVHSQDVIAAPIASALQSDTGRGTLTLETATVIPLFYRKGAVATGVVVERLDAVATADSVAVRVAMRRIGNAAFVGSAQITMEDSAGQILARADRQLAVYNVAAPRWSIPITPAIRASAVRVAFTLSTVRHDVPQRLVLQSPTIRRETPLRGP